MKRKQLLCLLLVLFVILEIMNIKEQIQNPKEVKEEVTLKVDLDSDGEFKTKDIDESFVVYYDTKEEAIANSEEVGVLLDYPYAREIDTPIKSIESEKRAIFFYLSYESEKRGCYVTAEFYKKEIDGKTQYGLVSVSPGECIKNGIGSEKNPEKNVRFSLKMAGIERMMGYRLEDEDERLVWGMSKLEEVNNLLLDGQRPDEVIKYKHFDTDCYFWYYRDLESDADASEIEIEFEEE